MQAPHVGLLPLYLALYDKTIPSLRDSLEPFRRNVAATFTRAGVRVCELPICRLRAEVAQAVAKATAEDVDLLVTLHLAYSPSLEAVDSLAAVRTPLLLLDVTPDASFSQQVDPACILTNHGIHGVQDLANLLARRGKPFRIVAGHLSDARTAARAVGLARAAAAAREFRQTRALRVGPAFVGMGDFQVEEGVLAGLGVGVVEIGPQELAPAVEAVTGQEIVDEIARDRERFDVQADPEVHQRSAALGLGIRAYLRDGDYTAWSMNFGAFDQEAGPVSTVPFLAASKLMGEGIGYAGEGDVLTAALVGALQRAFGGATFTEMFCADWQGGAIFLSHMGEANPEVAAGTPLLHEKEYPYSPTCNPAALAFSPRPGPATLVNLAPLAGDAFRLVCAPLEVQEDVTPPEFAERVRAWVRPRRPVAEFLEEYSRQGGTHHSALVLGEHEEAMRAFADFLGFDFAWIG